ncbi:MipA/OmpV family protein [Massilia sp. RP-1-19]|uniref:MipA/OmpV family protein n=1 Tax=Massilia polaris TaxID=2728846 RepID=A0A848HKB1_9BURK|nr:MipA/OmpV family protein [Massilia polaris]
MGYSPSEHHTVFVDVAATRFGKAVKNSSLVDKPNQASVAVSYTRRPTATGRQSSNGWATAPAAGAWCGRRRNKRKQLMPTGKLARHYNKPGLHGATGAAPD